MLYMNLPSECFSPTDYAGVLNKVVRYTFFFFFSFFGLEALWFLDNSTHFSQYFTKCEVDNCMAKWNFRPITVKRDAVVSAKEGTVHHVPGSVKESFTLRTS